MDCNSKIFQYDVNVFVSVPDGIKWVDYNTDPVTRVEVLDRKARIPDEYLETAGTKLMWFCVDDQTRFLHSIYVEKRPVPPDHATTPTETITFATLVEKVNNLIDEAEEAIETIEEKMSRMVLYLSQSSNVYHLRNAQGSEVSFDELLTMCRTESIYVVILYGNSKLRPQYVSTNEIHADGEDRDSLGAMFLRMVMTPTSLYYSVARLKDEPEFISMKSDKLSKPSSFEVGKYFRIASIDALGNPILEAVDLPVAGQEILGMVKTSTNHNFKVENDYILGVVRSSSEYDENLSSAIITKGTLENIKEQLVRSALPKWEKLYDVTFDEDVSSVNITTTDSGEPLSVSKMVVYVFAAVDTSSRSIGFRIYYDNTSLLQTLGSFTSTTNVRVGGVRYDGISYTRLGVANEGSSMPHQYVASSSFLIPNKIITRLTTSALLKDSRVLIYGIKA